MVKNMRDKISTATNYSVSGGLIYGGLTGWFYKHACFSSTHFLRLPDF